MKSILETLRFFLLSLELVVVIVGLVAEQWFSHSVLQFFALVKLSQDPLRFAVMAPVGLCGWMFVSGRKLLFPEKDKANILQEWADFWKLKAAFQAALTWSVIFAVISLHTWNGNWEHPSSAICISLLVSIVGSAVCFLTVYNAQITVEVAVSKYKPK